MITNKLGLPDFLVEAVKNDPYDRGDSWRSVTELIAPPKIALLERRHPEGKEEDVADLLYSLSGQIVHGIIERGAKKMKDSGWLTEKRIFAEVGGKKISGAYDFFHPERGHLIDVKYSTAWSGKQGKPKDEWILQLNCLASLLRKEGMDVKKAEILLIMRDWSKLEAKRNPSYPQAHAMMLETPLWPKNKAFFYLSERVLVHENCEKELIDCTDSERWLRNGTYQRCESYCPVSKSCLQHQSYLLSLPRRNSR